MLITYVLLPILGVGRLSFKKGKHSHGLGFPPGCLLVHIGSVVFFNLKTKYREEQKRAHNRGVLLRSVFLLNTLKQRTEYSKSERTHTVVLGTSVLSISLPYLTSKLYFGLGSVINFCLSDFQGVGVDHYTGPFPF